MPFARVVCYQYPVNFFWRHISNICLAGAVEMSIWNITIHHNSNCVFAVCIKIHACLEIVRLIFIYHHSLLVEWSVSAGSAVQVHPVLIFIIAVIVIPKHVQFFIAIVYGATSIIFWIGGYIPACVHRTVEAQSLILLQTNVNDTSIAGSFIFCRRVSDQLDRLNLRRR